MAMKTTPAEPKRYNTDSTRDQICVTYDATYDVVTNMCAPPVKPTPYAGFDPKIRQILPISLNDLGNHVACCHSDGNACFAEQFKVISTRSRTNKSKVDTEKLTI